MPTSACLHHVTSTRQRQGVYSPCFQAGLGGQRRATYNYHTREAVVSLGCPKNDSIVVAKHTSRRRNCCVVPPSGGRCCCRCRSLLRRRLDGCPVGSSQDAPRPHRPRRRASRRRRGRSSLLLPAGYPSLGRLRAARSCCLAWFRGLREHGHRLAATGRGPKSKTGKRKKEKPTARTHENVRLSVKRGLLTNVWTLGERRQ